MRAAMMVLIVLIAGCATTDRLVDRHASILEKQGKPPAYVDGYKDGCRSERSQRCIDAAGDDGARWVRDDGRMKSDADYALGFSDGGRNCTLSCSSGLVPMPIKQ